MKKKRVRNQITCHCSAYKFPHRMFGGSCSGLGFVQRYWESHYGSGACRNCQHFNSDEDRFYCEVDEGIEDVRHCEALKEYLVEHDMWPLKPRIPYKPKCGFNKEA